MEEIEIPVSQQFSHVNFETSKPKTIEPLLFPRMGACSIVARSNRITSVFTSIHVEVFQGRDFQSDRHLFFCAHRRGSSYVAPVPALVCTKQKNSEILKLGKMKNKVDLLVIVIFFSDGSCSTLVAVKLQHYQQYSKGSGGSYI